MAQGTYMLLKKQNQLNRAPHLSNLHGNPQPKMGPEELATELRNPICRIAIKVQLWKGGEIKGGCS